jgi:hypothetical protein
MLVELADEPNLCTSHSKGRAGVRCDEISQYHTSDLLLAFSFNISLAKKFCDHHTPDMKSLASMIRLESIHFLNLHVLQCFCTYSGNELYFLDKILIQNYFQKLCFNLFYKSSSAIPVNNNTIFNIAQGQTI